MEWKKSMKIQLIRIMICLLMILPVFSLTTVADPGPELEINIAGSLPLPLFSNVVGGVISNIGDAPAYNITYLMTIQGGFNGAIYNIITGDTNEILPGNGFGATIMYTYGFGPVTITMTASTSNAEAVTETVKGFQIGSFTWVPLSWLFLLFNG